jgi:hypothetical protein
MAGKQAGRSKMAAAQAEAAPSTPEKSTGRPPTKAKTTKADRAKRPPGRPSRLTIEVAEQLCLRLMEGASLRAACQAEGMPAVSTVLRWLADPDPDKDWFRRLHGTARYGRAWLLADEIIEIADDGSNDTYEDDEGQTKVDYDIVMRSKLRVDARKFVLSKLMPERFGAKVQPVDRGQEHHEAADRVDRWQVTIVPPTGVVRVDPPGRGGPAK